MQYCRISEDLTLRPPPSACRLFSLYLAFTARIHGKGRACALRERWKAFFCPRQCPYFLNKVVGESRTCGDTLGKVIWWFCINMHDRDSPGEKLQVHFVHIITGHEISLLVQLQWEGDSPVNSSLRSVDGSDRLEFWKRRQSILIFFPAFFIVIVPNAVVVESWNWNCTCVTESVALQLGCSFCRELWLATRANSVNCLW